MIKAFPLKSFSELIIIRNTLQIGLSLSKLHANITFTIFLQKNIPHKYSNRIDLIIAVAYPSR